MTKKIVELIKRELERSMVIGARIEHKKIKRAMIAKVTIYLTYPSKNRA